MEVDVQTIFQGIRERYVKFVYNSNVRSDLQLREKARCIEKETFLNLYGNLEKSVKNKYPPGTITREKILLDRQFETVKQRHSEFCVICDNSQEKVNLNWLLNLIEQFSKINSIAYAYLKSLLDRSHELKSSNEKKSKCNIKMEQMTSPRFYGEPRYYHRFIRDFHELVRPNLEEREAAFTFRQCLGKEVETVLGSGDYNLDEMITRLDGKYGDPSKMIDSVIGEIRRYRKIDYDDYKRLIEFVNILERAFHDLKC